jgi:hypothetical protein
LRSFGFAQGRQDDKFYFVVRDNLILLLMKNCVLLVVTTFWFIAGDKLFLAPPAMESTARETGHREKRIDIEGWFGTNEGSTFAGTDETQGGSRSLL